MSGSVHSSCAAEVSDAEEMELLITTPTKTKVSLSDAPAAVTVVTAKDIKAKNVSRLGDVLDQVPSLYLRDGALGQSQGTSGTSGMSLRGVDQSRTIILLDGQPIQDARSGKVNWRIPFVDDIARVEVVPGAFSSLYGSNAIGGVINIITKQPDKHEFTAKVKKGWGDASGEDVSVYFRDKMDNGLGFVAGVGYQNRDSYVNDFVVKIPTCPTPPAPCTPGTPVTGAQPTTTRD
ncbi:MAG: TonB-dependent receptor plug domain-containing protein, partial [Gallionella sp.]